MNSTLTNDHSVTEAGHERAHELRTPAQEATSVDTPASAHIPAVSTLTPASERKSVKLPRRPSETTGFHGKSKSRSRTGTKSARETHELKKVLTGYVEEHEGLAEKGKCLLKKVASLIESQRRAAATVAKDQADAFAAIGVLTFGSAPKAVRACQDESLNEKFRRVGWKK
jgi:hypothetical protein